MKSRSESGRYYHEINAECLENGGFIVVRESVLADVKQEFAERGFILRGGAGVLRDGELFKIMHL